MVSTKMPSKIPVITANMTPAFSFCNVFFESNGTAMMMGMIPETLFMIAVAMLVFAWREAAVANMIATL